MMNKLISLDIYGVKPNLLVNGKKAYKSCFGCVATGATFCLAVVFGFLFGSDFFFRANPNLISQEKIQSESPVIYPTSATFPVFFSLMVNNSPVTSYGDTPVKMHFNYSYLKRDDEGRLRLIHREILVPKPCSQTEAVNNPLMSSYNLDELFCLDWEELEKRTGEPPRLGGTSDENEFALFRIIASNATITSAVDDKRTYLTYAEARNFLENNFVTTYIYFPSFFLDADSVDNPIIEKFESQPFNIKFSTYRVERRTFEMSVLEDDIGWIFKDVVNYQMIRENKLETEVAVNFESEEGTFIGFYQLISYLGKKTTILRRKFMKIQELLAIIGSFVKVIHLGFQSLVAVVAGFKMNMFYLKATSSTRQENKHVLKNSYVDNSNLSVNPKPDKKIKITLTEYLISSLGCKQFASKGQFDKDLAKVNQKMDVVNLILLHDKVELMELNKKEELQQNNMLNKN